jgi:F-type H+-transporting ATPase subunit delta
MARRDTAARRYAEAAFDIGRTDRTLDAWERDLARLREALAAENLRTLVEHPGVPYADKERVVRRVVGDVAPEALNLVLLMVRRGRPRAIDRMVDHFGELVRRHRGIALAEVRTALPLEESQRVSVMDRLHELTGDEIEINEVVDESLIGGITVRIGDRLYDASVRNRLERLRARLTAV